MKLYISTIDVDFVSLMLESNIFYGSVNTEVWHAMGRFTKRQKELCLRIECFSMGGNKFETKLARASMMERKIEVTACVD